jgi:hypothetical protein
VPSQAGSGGDVAGGLQAVAGGSEGALAAAGPVGLAVLAAKVIKDKIETGIGDIFRGAANSVAVAGEAGSAAIRGNNADAVGQVGTGMLKLAGELPVVGDKLKVLGDVAQKTVGAFVGVVDAFTERGRELRGYSGALAGSYAQSDVRSLLGDIKEAQQLGPEIARINDSQSKMSDMLRDLLLPIKKAVADNLAGWMESMTKTMQENYANAVLTRHLIAATPDLIKDWLLLDITKLRKDMQKAIKDAVAEVTKKDKPSGMPIDEMLRALDAATPKFVAGIDPAAEAGHLRKINVPLLRDGF